jgi:integrase
MTETKKGGRKATGTVITIKSGPNKGCYQGVVTLPNGKRKRLKPPYERGTSLAYAQEKTAYWAERYSKAKIPEPETTTGEKTEATHWWDAFHAHREGQGKYSVRNMHETHIAPALAGKHPRDWTKADCEAVRDSLDAKISAGSWKTDDGRSYKFGWKRAWNVWTVFTSACKAASASKNKELRVRQDNPCASVLPPDRGKAKQKQWLYPIEFEQLMACEAVPVERRRLYALLAYTYLRPSELAALTAKDIELDVGLINVTKTWNFETNELKDYPKSHAGVRPVPIEPTLVPLLKALLDGLQPDDELMPDFPATEGWARALRVDLRRAKIDRASLYEDTPTVKRIGLYDLRASGITWRTLRRDDPRDIQRDCGHEKYATTEIYVRAASVYRDRVGAPFGPLPELGNDHENRSRSTNRAELTSFKGAHNLTPDQQSSGKDAGSASVKTETEGGSTEANPANAGAGSEPSERSDHGADLVEQAMAEALKSLAAAAAAGNAPPDAWERIGQLCRELEARRKARQAPAVVDLGAERERRGGKR